MSLSDTVTKLEPPRNIEPPEEATKKEYTISFCSADQVLPLRRINSLLLPVRYPDSFYDGIVSDATVRDLTRVAIWHGNGRVIGGVRCRLEHTCPPMSASAAAPVLYVQSIALLSPYQGKGVATAMLDKVLATANEKYVVKHVYAHVWEANDEALEWYRKRGFDVSRDVQPGYYSRLKPNGARVVSKRL